MDELTRRHAIQVTTTLGLMGVANAAEAGDKPEGAAPTPAPDTDRGRVIAAGMTEAEADCWEITAKAAGAFFALPELHPMDKAEVASAIHVIQNKLLSRPSYRRYLELARAAAARAK